MSYSGSLIPYNTITQVTKFLLCVDFVDCVVDILCPAWHVDIYSMKVLRENSTAQVYLVH
jgi:hypothetical protein